MTRVITIAGTALTSVTQLESIIVGGQASYGSSTLSEVTVYDETNALFGTAEHFVRKQWSVTEDASGTAVYLARGRIAAFETHRGEDDSIMAAKVQYTFSLEDQNLELRGFDVHGWVRPAETDYARVQAPGSAYLNGSPRATTVLNYTTYVPNTSTVDLPAKTYYAADALDVLQECAQAADKMFFVTVDHELYYDLQAGTAYTASIEISDGVAGATAPDGTTYFAPIWDVGPALTWEGQDYASRVRLGYNQDSYISVTNATSEALHDYWYAHIFDNEITTAAEGSAIASSEAAYRIIGQRSYQCSIHMPAAQVYKVKVGHSIWIQSQAAVDATGRVRRRVAELKWEPDGPDWYFARLTLDQPIRARRRRSMTGSPSTGPKPAPASVPDTAGSAVYTWTWTTHENDDATNTYDAGLLRSTVGFGSAYFDGPWGTVDGAHYQSQAIPLSASTEYTFYCDAAWKYDPTIRNVDLQWRDGTTVLRTDRWITGAGHATYTEYVESATFTSPVGTTELVIKYSPYAGLKIDNLSISTTGTVTADDPYALPDGGDSPYYARSDDPRFDTLAEGVQDLADWKADQFDILQANSRVLIWANRGDLKDEGDTGDSYPENTLEGFRQAVLKGADGIEIDILQNADGSWVAMHDTTVDRTTDGTGNVADKTDAQWAALNIDEGYGYNATRHGTSLAPPFLADIFDACEPYQPLYLLEVKGGDIGELLTFLIDRDLPRRTIIAINDGSVISAADVRDESEVVQVMQNAGGTGDGDAQVEWLSASYATVTSLAYTTALAPQMIHSYIPIGEYESADEDAIFTDMIAYGIRSWESYDISRALRLRAAALGGIGTDVTSPAEGDMLRYDGSAWVNTPGRWEPVTDGVDTFVWDGDEIVMAWKDT